MNDYPLFIFEQINFFQPYLWILPVILLLFLLFIYLNHKKVEIDSITTDRNNVIISKKTHEMPFWQYFREELVFYAYDILDYGEDLYGSMIYDMEKHLILRLKKVPLLHLFFKNYRYKYFIPREEEIREIIHLNRFFAMRGKKISRKKI